MSYLPLSMFRSPYPPYYPAVIGSKTCIDQCPYKLKVAGEGIIKVQPDMAEVVLGVSTENKQLKIAQEENGRKVTEIIKTLNRMGISPKDIETQSYSITPQYDYIEGKQVFRGYRVLHRLKITIRDLDKTGEIIDEAVNKGANVVNNINFTISEPSKYYRLALTAAIDDALTKAMDIGRKLKVDVSQIPIHIAEESYQYGAPIEGALSKMQESATPIQPGQMDITARIRAIFTYAPPYN